MTQRTSLLWQAWAVARRWGPALVTALGTILCVIALIAMSRNHGVTISPDRMLLAGAVALCAISLLLSASAWRAYLAAVSGSEIPFSVALRQQSMVLLGKYVPGKVAGIAARITANAGTIPARRTTLATAIEQAGGLVAAAMLGAATAVAMHSVLGSVLLVAVLVVSGTLLPGRVISLLPNGKASQIPAMGMIARGFVLQLMQWSMLILLAAVMSKLVRPDLEAATLIALGGLYGLAVVAGQLAFVFPGGIGPREAAFAWLASAQLPLAEAFGIAFLLRVATTLIDLASLVAFLPRGSNPHTDNRS